MAKKRGRRARGEGSAYYREDKDLYCGQVRVPDPAKPGMKITKTVYGKTEAEVREKMRKHENNASLGIVDGSKQLFSDFIEEWALNQKAKGAWRPNSVARSKSAIKIHIKPRLGHLRLGEIRDYHIEQFLEYLRLPDKETAKIMATATQRRIYDVLKPALRHARKRKLIPFDPTETVDAPKIVRKERSTLGAEQAKRFIAAFTGTRMEGILTMAIITGCRQGELLALTWNAIDFEQGTIFIHAALSWDNDAKQFVVGPPKTKRGVRTIKMIPALAKALLSHKERMLAEQKHYRKTCGKDRQDVASGLVFANRRNGGFIERSNIRRSYERLLKIAGITGITFHDLRHTCASIMVDEGLEMHDISKQLGHSDPGFTSKTYVHLTSKSTQRAAKAQESAWNRINSTNAVLP